MRSKQQTKTKKITTSQMVYCAIFSVLIIVGAFIKIPVPVVPFTLQIFFVYMAGLILGAKLGAASVGIYALIGLVGLPVFAEGGGFGYVFKPSFGYIIGFIIAAYVIGIISSKTGLGSFWKIVGTLFVGLLIDYAVGMVYYYVICNYVIDSPIGLWPLFLYCFLLAVPGDVVLCFVAAVVVKRVKPQIDKIMSR